MEDYREKDNNICLSRFQASNFLILDMKQVKLTISNSFTIKKCIFSTYFTKNNQAKTLVEDPPHENCQSTPMNASSKKCAPLISAKKP
jgi:hypothetical protein